MAKVEPKATGEQPQGGNLTKKQFVFVTEYLQNGGNATAAYRSAYNAQGMSEATVNVEACKLLKNPKITPRLRAIADRTHQMATERVSIDRAWVINRLVDNAEAAYKAADFTASNKSLELLGKTKEIQLFAEENKSPDGNGVTINLVSFADADRQSSKQLEATAISARSLASS